MATGRIAYPSLGDPVSFYVKGIATHLADLGDLSYYTG